MSAVAVLWTWQGQPRRDLFASRVKAEQVAAALRAKNVAVQVRVVEPAARSQRGAWGGQ